MFIDILSIFSLDIADKLKHQSHKMSNYGRDKALGELWAEILRRHWDYMEQEDNYEKIVRSKKLEGQFVL